MPNTTLADRILKALQEGPMTDRELTDKLKGHGSAQQDVNQACRLLRDRGVIMRSDRPIYNSLPAIRPLSTEEIAVPPSSKVTKDADFSEETLKQMLNAWLIKEGWETRVAWGYTHGVDIEARRGFKHWFIEVKGKGSRDAMRVNYFLGILGEILQRMDDPNAQYSIALPDMQQYRRLWQRLPQRVKQNNSLSLILLSETGIPCFL
ncbi:MAG TPA: hypothetical protein PKN45_02695 [Candidatus Limiplasma sp.]|nr:hypothetical protein [Candidatus Limiplasma sp.]